MFKIACSAVVFGLLAAGCQTYDFQPVTPLAVTQTTQSRKVAGTQLKPNLMLLVDNSGSMGNPPAPTRMDEVKSAMSTFLSTSGDVARMGLVHFPSNNSCGEASTVDEPLPTASNVDDSTVLKAKAQAVNSKIQILTPAGGTPTGGSLAFTGTIAGLNDASDNRQDFILLLTDGLPNCNANNPNGQCAGPNAACACTLCPANNPGCNSCTPPSSYCAQGCLDRSGSVQAVQDLRAKSIKVIVIGFGTDFATADALDTLNAMAEAGGFARTCPNGTDAECGNTNTCNQATKICNKQFYTAGNATELATALANISLLLGGGNPCEFSLDAQPNDPRFLAVIIDGVNVPSGPDTWAYTGGKVIFQGALCTKATAASTAAPLQVEIRIVETL